MTQVGCTSASANYLQSWLRVTSVGLFKHIGKERTIMQYNTENVTTLTDTVQPIQLVFDLQAIWIPLKRSQTSYTSVLSLRQVFQWCICDKSSKI